MPTGKIVRWNGHSGHVKDDASGTDCHFDQQALRGLLPADVVIGLVVEFDRGVGTRGPTARNVRPLSASSQHPDRPAVTGSGNPSGPRKLGQAPATPPAIDNKELLKDIPVPPSLRELLDKLQKDPRRHPGLMLDRFNRPCVDQKQQREILDLVANLPGDPIVLQEQLTRRADWLGHVGARTWARTTEGPLTLHLARASALENAGLCLHPLYGFAYLPGTGLKGLARSYAETVWLPTQRDPVLAWQQIEQVFGWAPGSDSIGNGKTKPWKPDGVPKRDKGQEAASGQVVFHDAWPEKWPGLFIDIVNNHHPEYYQGKEPTGDWQSPVPVYFLAIKPRTAFSFALSKRRYDVSDELLTLACHWLDGGLTELGCGAKTAAGYGAFTALPGTKPVVSPRRLRESYTLELVTPAYLAGASQQREDCDLRSATLRGLLRWWWRTMHVGYVDDATLRAMEAAVWGDTNAGGAVQVRVTRIAGEPIRSPYKSPDSQGKLKLSDSFARQHRLNTFGVSGLGYAGYGMDEMSTPGSGQPTQRRQRWCLEPGARWRVDFAARPGLFELRNTKGEVIRQAPLPDASLLLEQAKTAFWWFCTLGGAGSKSRKGFGSFAMPAELLPFEGNRWVSQGNRLRTACGFPDAEFSEDRVSGPSLKLMRQLSRAVIGEDPAWLEVPTTWQDPWRVMDLIGTAMMHCAQANNAPHGKHSPEKRGLGLPRKIHGPTNRAMKHQNPTTHRPPEELVCHRGDRHSSPVLFHVSRNKGNLTVHVAGFPTADLRDPGMQSSPGLAWHLGFLTDYLLHLREEFTALLDDTPRGRNR